jgi:hypothetical protein
MVPHGRKPDPRLMYRRAQPNKLLKHNQRAQERKEKKNTTNQP